MAYKHKLLLKQGVITAGRGERRAVLCYDSGLIYDYDAPDRILGQYWPGKGWVVLKQPYYKVSGWGHGSRGDVDGGRLIKNAESLVLSIGARLLRINTYDWITPTELKRLNRDIERNNRLIESQNKLAERLGRFADKADAVPLIERLKIEPYERVSVSGTSPKGIDPISTVNRYAEAARVFTDRKGRAVKIDKYTVSPDLIKLEDTVVAFRDSNGDVFLNSQALPMSQFEKTFMGGQSLIQAAARKVAKFSIPFNVLASADLKLSETRILEQGPESTHKIKRNQWDSTPSLERHFTGALLLENAGRKFLMDIDRLEIKHGLFNAFFVEVNRDVKTIDEAYESMKPDSVRKAEAAGIEVRRQGEWFFIDTGKTVEVFSQDVMSWEPTNETQGRPYIIKRAVSHGKGRPNNLFKPVGFGDLDQYVCGTVSHQGREHADLDLGQDEVTSSGNGDRTTFRLWELVGNTTVSNFTINGDID